MTSENQKTIPFPKKYFPQNNKKHHLSIRKRFPLRPSRILQFKKFSIFASEFNNQVLQTIVQSCPPQATVETESCYEKQLERI